MRENSGRFMFFVIVEEKLERKKSNKTRCKEGNDSKEGESRNEESFFLCGFHKDEREEENKMYVSIFSYFPFGGKYFFSVQKFEPIFLLYFLQKKSSQKNVFFARIKT